jgi:hypothetical protein
MVDGNTCFNNRSNFFRSVRIIPSAFYVVLESQGSPSPPTGTPVNLFGPILPIDRQPYIEPGDCDFQA